MKFIQFWYNKMEGPWAHYLSHFMGGYVITDMFGSVLGMNIGFMIGITAAVSKEIIDKYSKMGTPELRAAIITIMGSLMSVVIYKLA